MALPPAADGHPAKPAWLVACQAHLDRHPDQPVSIESLVRLCGKTQEHVTRCFRQHLGLTPSEFVNARRLKQAERLLVNTDLPVKAVASRLGFANQVYFFRLFRRTYGTSPREFRNRHPLMHGDTTGRQGAA